MLAGRNVLTLKVVIYCAKFFFLWTTKQKVNNYQIKDVDIHMNDDINDYGDILMDLDYLNSGEFL